MRPRTIEEREQMRQRLKRSGRTGPLAEASVRPEFVAWVAAYEKVKRDARRRAPGGRG